MVTFDMFKKELDTLPTDFIVLVTVNSKSYTDVNIMILRYLCNERKLGGIYITINKPYQTIKELLQKAGVNVSKLFFIDAITKTANGEPERRNDVLYMDSPENLTDLAVAMDQVVVGKKSGRFMFLDSLSTLKLYNSLGTVTKFSHFITTKMRVWGLKGVLMSLEGESDPALLSQMSQYCDKIINISENGS